MLLLVFAIAFTPNRHWLTWSLYASAGLALLWIAKLSWKTLAQRVALEGLFVSTIALGAVFSPQGTPIWQWGWLHITDAGLALFASVMVKAILSLLLLNLLIMTTPMDELLAALTALRCPPLLIAIVASMYRYLTVLMAEFQVMQRAAAARNLTGIKRWQRVVAGNMIGALFIRTYERGDRIYQAMLSRGYQGVSKSLPISHRLTWLDYGILAMVGSCIFSGQLIYFLRF